ncbi:MAG TPA: methyl-accepting chemotaxis protein [Candidatus Acidoferrales bacterium]|nr:methyl-accepting chemotaxis protein [Candidatus Acidoferrales bacterium]
MTISKKLFVGFGSILLISSIVFVVIFMALLREHSVRDKAASTLDSVHVIEKVRYDMMEARLDLRNFLLSGDPRIEAATNKQENDLTEYIAAAKANTSDEVLRNALEQVAAGEQDWNQTFCQPLIAKRHQVDSGDSTVSDLQVFYLEKNPGSWVGKSVQTLDDAETRSNQSLNAAKDSAQRASNISMFGGSVGMFLAVLLGLAIAYYTAKSVTEPLDHLIDVAHEIGSAGDLEHNIDIHREDEIGRLADNFRSMVLHLKRMAGVSAAVAEGELTVEIEPLSRRDTMASAFSRMARGLREIVRRVRDTASQVAAGAGQMAAASEESAKISIQAASAIDEVTSTMHEMSINVQNVVKNTQVQASSVAETSASIEQMVASIQRVADTAKILLDICHRSRVEVETGITTMEKATDGLNRTSSSIQSSSEIIGLLGKRADNIGKIIEVIDDLAEQTNLLALNAAIEAARAGEHGLGFAVVADEVRKLAEKSTQSTKEIAELIQGIQDEARTAVNNMATSTQMVQDGLLLGLDLNKAFGKISNVVSEVYKFAQEIGAATNEQSSGSSQIAKATTRLTEITQEITSSVEEQASGAQGVVRAMEKMREIVQQSTSSSTELAATAEQMAKLSRVLLESMDRFRIDQESRESNRSSSWHGNGRRNSKETEDSFHSDLVRA